MVRSTDGGLTWPAEHEVLLAAGTAFFLEPVLTLLPGGQVMALLRTDEAARADPFRRRRADLDRARGAKIWASSADTVTLSDGSVLLAYGDASRTTYQSRPAGHGDLRDRSGRGTPASSTLVRRGDDTFDQRTRPWSSSPTAGC